MIAFEKISMSFTLPAGRVDVLADVDSHIASGETVAIVGPSGSGKTTLLLLLAGLEQPSAGRVLFNGNALDSLSADELADWRRDRLGIVFQSFHLVPSLDALSNVALPLEIAGRDDAREQAAAMLTRVGLAERADHFPSQLSGGEQQRVALARALVHRPDLVLADEPTGNLDADTGTVIIDLLFELHREAGTTLVLVTHDQDLAKRCDRVLRLDQGRLHKAA